MPDLKPYFDAVNAANEEVQRIASELDAHFREGTDEGRLAALALRPALDEAQKAYDEAVSLYEAMQLANRPNDIAKNFVPVSNTETEPADGSQPTVIKRAQYDQMSLVDRANLIRSGGKIED